MLAGKPPPVPPRPSKAAVAAALARTRLAPVPMTRTVLPTPGNFTVDEQQQRNDIISTSDEDWCNGRARKEEGNLSDKIINREILVSVKEEGSHNFLHNGVFSHVEQHTSVKRTTAEISFSRDVRQQKIRYGPLLPTGQHRHHAREVLPPQVPPGSSRDATEPSSQGETEIRVVVKEKTPPPIAAKPAETVLLGQDSVPPPLLPRRTEGIALDRDKLSPLVTRRTEGVVFDKSKTSPIVIRRADSKVLKDKPPPLTVRPPPLASRHCEEIVMRKASSPPVAVRTLKPSELGKENESPLVTKHFETVSSGEPKTPPVVARSVTPAVPLGSDYKGSSNLPSGRTPPVSPKLADCVMVSKSETQSQAIVRTGSVTSRHVGDKSPPNSMQDGSAGLIANKNETRPHAVVRTGSGASRHSNRSPPNSVHEGSVAPIASKNKTQARAVVLAGSVVSRHTEEPPHNTEQEGFEAPIAARNEITPRAVERSDSVVSRHSEKSLNRQDHIVPPPTAFMNGETVGSSEQKAVLREEAAEQVGSPSLTGEGSKADRGLLKGTERPLIPHPVIKRDRGNSSSNDSLSLGSDRASPKEAPLIEDLVVELRESSRQRNARIHHSDWYKEDADGQQVRFSSCHITLQDLSQADPLSPISHVNCSHEKQHRRVMASLQGLPPLPKSLSGFNLLELAAASSAPANPTSAPFRQSRAGPSHHGQQPLAAPRPRKSTGLDAQLAILRKEMFGLRQLDLSLLSQLWSLNESIQEFRQLLQEQEDSAALSPPSPSSADEGEEFYSPLPRYHAPPGLQLSAVPEQYRLSSSSSQSSIEYGNV